MTAQSVDCMQPRGWKPRCTAVQAIAPLFLSFLMLVGSVGVTVNRHFCRGELKSVAVFAEVEACHQEATEPVCPLHAAAKKGCCNDEHEFVKSDIDKQLVDATDLPTPPAFTPLLLKPLTPPPAQHLRPRPTETYLHYRPPPLLIDVPRLYQVFRI